MKLIPTALAASIALIGQISLAEQSANRKHSSINESTKKYFEDKESIKFDEDRLGDNNRNDRNPLVTIKEFDQSAFEDLEQYDVLKSDLSDIVEKNLKKNRNRYTVDRLNNLAEQLTAYYRNKGLLLAKVYLPKQAIKNQTLKFELLLGEITEVVTENNESYSDDRLKRPFLHLVNEPVYIPSLESSLTEINRYPGIDLVTRFSEGDSVGTTRVKILAVDEKYKDFKFSFDNYGSDFTGTYRGNLNAEFYNLAGMADQLSFNALMTIDPSNAFYGGLQYKFNVAPYFSSLGDKYFVNDFLNHGFNFVTSYQLSSFTVGDVFEELNIEGEVRTATVGVNKDFLLQKNYQLNLGAYLHNKNALTTGNGRTEFEDIISTLEYSTTLRWNDFFLGPAANLIKLDFTRGLPGFAGALDNEDDVAISRSSPFGERAPLNFQRTNLIATRNQKIGEYWLLTQAKLQETENLMLSTEQVNMGGPTAVRGFKTSDFSADRASVFTIEISSRSNAKKFAMPISDLKLAGFIDHGVGERLEPFKSERQFAQLTSVGGYAEFLKEGSFRSKLEIAIPVSKLEDNQNTESFEILFSFERGL